MLESLLCLAVATGCRRALSARHSFALLNGAALVYLLAADLLAAWMVSKPHHVFDVFSYAFLGPLVSRDRVATFLPLPTSALSQPLILRALRIALASATAWRCLRESSRLNPLVARAYVLDGLAMPFVAAALVEGIECVLLLWALALAG